jgi:histidinol-phosphate/aromatic aminotransferase/cobyric acid decarboxylase-like protein/choline kinase
MQALILAAGKGSRLGVLTQDKTKCMVDIAGKKIIDRLIDALIDNNISSIIIVIGYLGNILKDYLKNAYPDVNFTFVDETKLTNREHNNIYSFLAAKDELVKDDTIILESDIIIKPDIIKSLLDNIIPNQAVISPCADYMNGSAVTLDETNHITDLINTRNNDIIRLYKTVNIYKFSKEFLSDTYIPCCEAYMNAYGVDCYYEEPLANIVKSTDIIGYVIDNNDWFEVDTQDDYDIANILFADPESKYQKLCGWFGGYHKIPNLVDCCYLTNPFFNIETLIQDINPAAAIKDYPAGVNRSITHLSRFYNIPENYISVGNGASELIKALSKYFNNVSINEPTFGEYRHFFNINDNNHIKIIVNPNNPRGWIDKDSITIELDASKEKNQTIIVDESFIDFVPVDKRYSLLSRNILDKYPNLIVLKSLGKSFGLNGLRIGLIASSNIKAIESIKLDLPSWNINSIIEEILSKIYLEKSNYEYSLEMVANEARRVFKELTRMFSLGIDGFEYNGANFVVMHLTNISSYKFCVDMLDRYNIIFKDLSSKLGEGYIRISINTKADNDYVLNSIRDYIQSNNQR